MREAVISKRTVQSIGPRLICSSFIVLLLVLTGVQAVQAQPQSLTQAQSQAAALEAQLKQLKDQAAVLRGAYDSANAQLAQTEADAADNAALLAQAQQDQASAESALSDRLTHIYKQGRSGTLSILLTSTSLSDLVHRLALLHRISKQDADLLRQVTTYRAQVADKGAKLTAQLEKQVAAAGQVEAARRAMTQKLVQTKQLLKGKEADVAQLEQEWQAQLAKQAHLEQERQAKLQAALAAAQAAAQTAAHNGGGSSSGKGGGSGTGSSNSGGSGQIHYRAANILRPEQIALVAQKAGFSGENLVIAVAVAMTESGSNANSIGRLHTYGLWQVLSSAHPSLINPSNPDASRWYDPYVNASFAWKISSRGTTWTPWSVYKSRSYLRNMDKARAGVDLLLSDPQSVAPPTVK
jgi:peptidoglycan hydrolase CwlO-like protein